MLDGYDGTIAMTPKQAVAAVVFALFGLFIGGYGAHRVVTSALPVIEGTARTLVVDGCQASEERDRNRRGPDRYWLVMRCANGTFVYADTFGAYDEVKGSLSDPADELSVTYAEGAEADYPYWLADGDPILAIRRENQTIRSREHVEMSFARHEQLVGGIMGTFGAVVFLACIWAGVRSERLRRYEVTPDSQSAR